MFNEAFIDKAIRTIMFIAVYTIIFILFFLSLPYTAPFVIALIIALLTRPFTLFLKKKLKFSKGLAALTSTLLVYIILFIVITLVSMKITVETKELLVSMPSINSIVEWFKDLLSKLQGYYKGLDPSVVENITNQISVITANVFKVVTNVINLVLKTAFKIPSFLMMIFVSLLATVLFSKDLLRMEIRFSSIFSTSGKDKVKAIWLETVKMISGYAKSYSVLLSLTFLESYIGFSIIGVKYALILSILCALMDILPLIGISLIYWPLAIIYFATGRYAIGISVLVLLTIVTVIRQVIEPKLYASNLGLNPAAVLAAIFIGLKSFGFLGMLYFLFLLVLLKIFNKVKLL